MKLTLISDLHLDFMADDGDTILSEIDPNTDLLCIAGDTCEAEDIETATRFWEKISARFPEVVFVAGNHEFLGSSPDETELILEDIEDRFPNVTHLENATLHLADGPSIHGATLWYPDGELNNYYGKNMIDFSHIRHFVPWVYNRHVQTVKYLQENIKEGDIVITHHAPHKNSIAPKYEKSALNRFFASDQSEIILNNKPAYWFHGHMHDPFDYKVGDTRIICAPCGYPHELAARDFKPVTIEI